MTPLYNLAMPQKADPVRLKVVVGPILHRTIFTQRKAEVPVFKGGESDEPDRQCGQCGNVLATGVMIRPRDLQAIWFKQNPSGGEYSVLSIKVPKGKYIRYEGGAGIKCASCGAFNELISA